MTEDPFHFDYVLLSNIEKDNVFHHADFHRYVKNVDDLMDSITIARKHMKYRMATRDCICRLPEKMCFVDVLMKHFSNKTLFNYLYDGDVRELDMLDLDISNHHFGFDIREVFIVYHNVKQLQAELYNVRDVLVK